MADKKLEKLLAEAEKAYAKQDKRKGAKLVDELLRKDYNYPGTWQLLFRLFGKGRSFDEFQRAFTLQYYPDQLYQLRKVDLSAPPEVPEKKPSFFARLFGRGKKKEAPTPAIERVDQVAMDAPAAGKPDLVAPGSSAASITPAQEQGFPPASSAERRSSSAIEIPRDAPPGGRSVRPNEPSGTGLLGRTTPAAAPSPENSPFSPRRSPAASSASGTMAAVRRAEALTGRDKIHVVVVDDIAQTRETVIRSLRFQDDIEVVGTASNGLQAIELVRELLPDVVIMDVNMPDMDGITATGYIKQEVPHAQIIILTVQDDVDYIRKAMMAGARDFLAKPPVIEELVAAVQHAAVIAKAEREKVPPPGAGLANPQAAVLGRGKIISVYSPRGGAGCTMLACNLAATLVNPDTRVVVVDGTLQFGDVEVFFNVQSRNTIVDLAPRIDEMDAQLIEDVLATHSSGIRLLLPSRPERSELVTGPQFSQIVTFLSQYYDYVIIDASHRLSDVTLAGLDASDLVLLLTTQDIPSIARTRKFLDLMPAMELDRARMLILMNQYDPKAGIEPEKVSQAFRTKIAALIPRAIEVVVPSINRGLPFMLQKEMTSRPIGRAMLEVVEAVRQRLVELDKATTEEK